MPSNLGPYLATPSPELRAYNDQVKADLLRQILRAHLWSLLAGAGLKALPFVLMPPEEEDTRTTSKKADWADQLVKTFLQSGKQAPQTDTLSWLRGDAQVDPWNIPWSLPALYVAITSGLKGGQEFMRQALRQKYENDLDKQLDQVQQEYEQALRDLHKQGSTEDLLDSLYQNWRDQKRHSGLPNLQWLLSAIFAHLAGQQAYERAQAKSPVEQLKEWAKQRHKQLTENRPVDLTLEDIFPPDN